MIGSTPQPRSRRVLRALLAHGRLPNPQACTPKQTALDIYPHQHTSGAARSPPSADNRPPLELDFDLSLPHRRRHIPTRPSPIPHVISPSLSHPIKRVWYVNIRVHNTRLRRPDPCIFTRVLVALPLLACSSLPAFTRSSWAAANTFAVHHNKTCIHPTPQYIDAASRPHSSLAQYN